MAHTVTAFLKTIKLNKKFAELFKATPRRALGEPPEAIFLICTKFMIYFLIQSW